MRVIHATVPLPAGNKQPPNDAIVPGTAYFEAVLFESGEVIPQGERPQPLSYWLSHLQPGADMVVPSGPRLIGVPAAIIPRAVLERLPADAKLDLRWHWSIARKTP